MASRPTIYVETSAWSALVDPRNPARQRATRDFLRIAAKRFRFLVSDLALGELRQHPKADIRRKIQRQLRRRRPRVLGPTARVRAATDELMKAGGWSARALADVTQMGYALVAGAQALVTWNQRDMARREVRRVIRLYCRKRNRDVMEVGTPKEVAKWLDVRM